MPKVPDDAVQAAAEVMLRQYESEFSAPHLTWRDFADPAREILEAAAPAIATYARKEAAVVILAQKELCRERPLPFPKPSCWTCGRNGAFQRAAMIASGLRDDLEAKAPTREDDDRG